MFSWDDFYALEKENFQDNPEDTGECWFSDCDAEEKMINFLFENLGSRSIKDDSRICDVGTGNGHLLFSLRDEGFKGLMKGIDYSENSVEFATNIAEEQEYEGFEFEVVDIYDSGWNPVEEFDIVLDKGTLDAIALSGLKYGDKTAVELYPIAVQKLMHDDSVLLITSCNFTEAELISIITKEGTLKKWKRIEYPSFEFGGVKGQTICSVAFIKS
jgi:cyclopropane fatty-acyl-phospholipid synthase-like methyltransferase